jgi:hypothetical protein
MGPSTYNLTIQPYNYLMVRAHSLMAGPSGLQVPSYTIQKESIRKVHLGKIAWKGQKRQHYQGRHIVSFPIPDEFVHNLGLFDHELVTSPAISSDP